MGNLARWERKKEKRKKALTGKRCHVGPMRRIKMRNPCWIRLRWKEIGNDGGRKGGSWSWRGGEDVLGEVDGYYYYCRDWRGQKGGVLGNLSLCSVLGVRGPLTTFGGGPDEMKAGERKPTRVITQILTGPKANLP